MAFADDIVLDMVEGDILGTKFIEELLAMVDQGESDNVARLTADRDRLRGEVENLVGSIASGVPADTVAPGIREREVEISRIEVRLRTPRQQPNIEKLRDALTQRAAEWKATLRSEPKVARLLLRRLIGPLVLYDESTRPDFIKADAVVKPGLLDGLAEIQDVASHADLSWNQVIEWLRNMAALRENPVFTGDSADSGRSTSPSSTGISTPLPAWNR